MIGVILWRDVADTKAVIWCEDQGDLAFFDGLNDSVDPDVILDVGDVVRFDVTLARNMRLAQNVTRLMDNWGSTLLDALSGLPQEATPIGQSDSAEIVPFGHMHSVHKREEVEAPRRRHG